MKFEHNPKLYQDKKYMPLRDRVRMAEEMIQAGFKSDPLSYDVCNPHDSYPAIYKAMLYKAMLAASKPE